VSKRLRNDYVTAANWINEADGILITAGAGMGVDSGLPDFRGDQGMWNHYPALAHASLSFTDIANPAAFSRNPELTWGFYGHRLNLYRNTTPHEGFNVLKNWASSKPCGAFVFTSNVDGQFQKAGFDAGKIYECHGSIHHLQCADECQIFWSADFLEPSVDEEQCRFIAELPRCPQCGALARPNILLFGDFNWVSDLYNRQAARYRDWLKQVAKPVVIEMGAGISIPTVRMESERRAKGRLIRINPGEPEIPPGAGISFNAGAMEALLEIAALTN